MDNKFEIVFCQRFWILKSFDIKHSRKILFNIQNLNKNEPDLFKKLTDEIWEFRTYIRDFNTDFLVFWDKKQTIKILWWFQRMDL